MDSEYRARPGDEFVEPMFAALVPRDSPESAERPLEDLPVDVGSRSTRWWWALALPVGLMAWELFRDWGG